MTLPISARDLAPGDAKSAALDLASFDLARIRSADHPRFDEAFARLWAEFGAAHEMETRGVLERRFRETAMRYEMFLVEQAGRFAAAIDHTAITTAPGEIIVHVSHILVAPEFRRTGLAGWMRALPLVTARECGTGPATLVAEMEHNSADDPRRAVRLRAFEGAGFLKIDPRGVAYFQADFRPPAEIDATGGAQPLPFQLVVRQVGREGERTMTGARVRLIVAALYAIYGAQFRAGDMQHPALRLDAYPPGDAVVALLPPTAS